MLIPSATADADTVTVMANPLAIPIMALALSTVVPATLAGSDPVYLPGSHYGAVLHRHSGVWSLLDADGGSIEFPADRTCAGLAAADLPRGLWLLTADEEGHSQLLALSATPLPPRHSGRVPLRECGQPVDGEVAFLVVPKTLLGSWASANVAVLVDD